MEGEQNEPNEVPQAEQQEEDLDPEPEIEEEEQEEEENKSSHDPEFTLGCKHY